MRSNRFVAGVLLVFAVAGCARDTSTTVVLSGTNLEGAAIEIWDERARFASFMETPTVAKATIDSTGRLEASFEVGSPGIYYLVSRKDDRFGSANLYLRPGQRLEVTADGMDWRNTVQFAGDFAGEQVAFQRIQRIGWARPPFREDSVDADTWVSWVLDFEKTMRAGISTVLDSVEASPEFRRHIDAWTDARLYYTRENYEFYQQRAGRTPDLPESLYNAEVILQKHRDLIADVPEIRRIAESPISDSVAMFIRLDPPLDSNIDWQIDYKLRRIAEGPDDFRRPYLYASALGQYVALGGSSPRIDSIVAAHEKDLPAKERAAILAMLAHYSDMQSKSAPDFEFLTPDSTLMRLSDLVGKVVYVDVWATWCGPCLVEMPFSNALRERFRDRDDLVFLYVSVDENKEAWYQMLADRTDFGGLHGHIPGGWEGPLIDEYKITGIPRAILVGKDGHLVRVSAPSPSSEEIGSMLEELLGAE